MSMYPPPPRHRHHQQQRPFLLLWKPFEQVNYVNAAAVAKETGLAIEVAFSERDPKGYLNGLTVEFEIDGVLNGRRTMTGKDRLPTLSEFFSGG